MATPSGPRPGNIPPIYTPNSLADNMQDLQLNQPNLQQPKNPTGCASRPPITLPFGQQPPPFAGTRPGPPLPSAFTGGLGSLALVAPRIHCHQMWHLLGPLAHHLDLSLLLVSLRDRFLLGRCHLLWVLPLFPLPVVLRRNWDLVLINNHMCLLL